MSRVTGSKMAYLAKEDITCIKSSGQVVGDREGGRAPDTVKLANDSAFTSLSGTPH